jgi:glycoside/pentoside/hexuronide:cation symporter, GPH family
MSNNNSHPKVKVQMGQKIAFGIGMLANQMFPAVLGIFAVILVEKLGFSGFLQGIAFFIPKFYDALLDLVMGYVSDNTKSKWGRRRQYVLAGAIILGVSFALLWQLYPEDGVTYNFMYFLGISFIFYSGLTIFSIPYVAMGYEMSDDFHERTSIMATSQLIGQLAWVAAPWLYVVMYDPKLFPTADAAVRTLSIYFAIGCAILAAVPAFFIPSKSTLNENYSPIDLKGILGSFGEIKEGLKASIEIKPFRKICIATFLIFNAFQTTAGFSYFIIKYYLFKGNENGFGLWPTLFGCIGAIITTVVVIPIVSRMSKVMGKKKAFLVSQGISVFGYILLYILFVPGKPHLFLFALPFFSFGIGSLFTLMMSMTSDVIDIDELNTGKRREGSLGAIYWWMVKFGTAVAALLSGMILSLVDFKSNSPTQTDETMFWLLIAFVGIPILGTSFAIWVMKDYDIDESKALEVRDLINKRKAQGKKQSSAYLPGKLISLDSNASDLNTLIGTDFSSKSEAEIKSQFSKILNNGLHGLCFSPYVEGQDTGDILSENQIIRRLDLIAPHTQWIRSFSCTEGNELIPEIAHKKGLKTLVGAWISDDKERNEKEIQSLIQLAKAGLVDIAAVGNEVLHREEISEQELIGYIQRVRAALPDSIPVGYVDAYYQFLNRPALVGACDVVLANCYPFWEGADNDFALNYLSRMVELTELSSNGKKVIITETGWPTKGENIEAAVPSHLNAMKYFIAVQDWAKNSEIELFYFSSFDESWKVKQEGEIGAGWGIWDKNENLKFNN